MFSSYARKDAETSAGREAVADFLAGSHDRSAIIFRRYDKLALLNILAIEERLKDLERQSEFDRDWLDRHGSKELEHTIRAYRKFLVANTSA